MQYLCLRKPQCMVQYKILKQNVHYVYHRADTSSHLAPIIWLNITKDTKENRSIKNITDHKVTF